MSKNYTLEQFEALSPEEKSKVSGFKHYSEEQIAEKAKKSEEVVTTLFKKFFQDLISQENLVIGHLKSDDEKESSVSPAMNNLYQNAIDIGATFEDVDAVQRALFSLAKLLDRLRNTYQFDVQRLSYQLTGENYPDALPIKTILNITKAIKESKENGNITASAD